MNIMETILCEAMQATVVPWVSLQCASNKKTHDIGILTLNPK